jgi:hypothetical protein
MRVWCVQHQDGWCACSRNRLPPEGATNVETKCRHFIWLPIGVAKRAPTCPSCRAAIKRRVSRESAVANHHNAFRGCAIRVTHPSEGVSRH